MKHYDVIIVGLGPTGGTLANLLALNGFSILILERENTFELIPLGPNPSMIFLSIIFQQNILMTFTGLTNK